MAREWIESDSLEDRLRELVTSDPDDEYRSAVWVLWGEIVSTMRQHGITQTELAERTGLKQSYISRVLSRPDNMTLRTAFRLCNALNLELVVKAQPKAADLRPDEHVERPARTPRPADRPQRARKAIAAQPV